MITNVYIIMSWMATVTESGFLKWTLITAAFFMYGFASMDMMAWTRDFHKSAPADLPSRSIRPWLSNGLIIHFQCFAAIYMASCVGVFDADKEQVGYFITTFGTKIAYCATFVWNLDVHGASWSILKHLLFGRLPEYRQRFVSVYMSSL